MAFVLTFTRWAQLGPKLNLDAEDAENSIRAYHLDSFGLPEAREGLPETGYQYSHGLHKLKVIAKSPVDNQRPSAIKVSTILPVRLAGGPCFKEKFLPTPDRLSPDGPWGQIRRFCGHTPPSCFRPSRSLSPALRRPGNANSDAPIHSKRSTRSGGATRGDCRDGSVGTFRLRCQRNRHNGCRLPDRERKLHHSDTRY